MVVKISDIPLYKAEETHLITDKVLPEYTQPNERLAIPLVQKLINVLKSENIAYCHWKSNHALHRSALGINDLDLLVSRVDGSRFTGALYRLGFKQAKAPLEKQMPGVQDFFGYDETEDKFIHVHAHYQLILGHDRTKNIHLPIELPYLASASQGDLFKTPAPEFEFILFVIRMTLKHSTWDAVLSREDRLAEDERKELEYFLAQINQDQVNSILNQHLPFIDDRLFARCIQVLQPGSSFLARIRTAYQLQTVLNAHTRHPLLLDAFLKLWRRPAWAIRRRIFRTSSKYRLTSGGGIIAIIGGDGAGKSTAVDALYEWLSKDFDIIKIHLGKPAWSVVTIVVRGILRIGQLLGLYPPESSFQETVKQRSFVSPGYPFLLREVCRARDRYRIFLKARRFANNGGVVIFDRFPLPNIQRMDGPLAEQFIKQLADGPCLNQFLSPCPGSRLINAIVALEKSYYQKIISPEILVVLRVEPKIAVQRKSDENAISVQERAQEIWDLNWDHTVAHIVDGSKSKTDVLSELKALIWAHL